jgi:thiamine pyrophosphokinase
VTPPATSTVVVVTGGDRPDPALLAGLGLPPAAERTVVAADSGAGHALALGFEVDVVVGDFDSLDPAALAAIEAAGAEVERHPVAKDATDLELALDTALALGPARVVVVGGHGGRLDHFLANALVLAAPRYAAVELDALVGDAVVSVLRPGREVRIAGRPGQVVTLLPVHGPAEGVRTEGLRYPLHGETLPAGTTRGVSNELVADVGTVRLDAGVVLVVRPAPPTASTPTTGTTDPTDDHERGAE